MAEGQKHTKRNVLIVVGVIVAIIVVIIAGVMIWITRGLSTYQKMVIGNVDLSKVADGTYQGTFKGGRFSNTLRVTVKDHKITRIAIVKDEEFARSKVSGELFDKVVAAQSLKVDTVTGATVSSKAYLKALENALNKSQ